jgi:hypothetical protein
MRQIRLQSKVALSLLVCLLSSQAVWAARFIDLSGQWCEKYVNRLSDQGVINAEPDGKFRPDEPVTRAVVAYWLVKVLGLDNQPVGPKPSFPDVKPTDWCYKPIEIIRQNNYISGYADGFRPNGLIQRAELIQIIARTLNTQPPDQATIESTLSKFSDKSKVPQWAQAAVVQCTIAGITFGSNATAVNAKDMATRGDTAAMMCKLNSFLTHQTIDETTAQATQVQSQPAQAPPQQGGYPPTFGGQAPYGQPGSQQIAQGYGQPGGYPGYAPQYQGRVTEQTQQQPPPPQYPPQYQPPPQYPPQYQAPPQYQQPAYAPPGAYVNPAQAGYPPLQGGYAANGYPPQQGTMLQGRAATVAAGTHFQATLRNSLDSETTQPGEPVEATLSSPIISGGVEVVPAGSKVKGQVTNVISAKRFRFGANGKIDIKFNSVETPDGRTFPLSGSIDDNQLRLTGGSTAGRIGKGLITTGIGAGGGAALGTGLGAIVGATSRGQVGRATGMGAAFGTALGAGVGLVGAGVRKGSEIKIPAGSSLPIQLDDNMQVTTAGGAGGMPYGQQQQFGYPQQGGYYPQQ